jgi:hypothetical protein
VESAIPQSSIHLRIRNVHRVVAVVLLAFIIPHIGNHLAALGGVATHIAVMDVLRTAYRQPAIEALLVLAFAVQMGLGLWLVRNSRGMSGFVAKAQRYSALYLVFFLLVHVSAVFLGRGAYGLDTNFYFAATGDHVPWAVLFFVPYYFLAVLAVFTHIGCALYWIVGGTAARPLLFSSMTAGLVAALTITGCLTGLLIPVEIPTAYLAPYSFLL